MKISIVIPIYNVEDCILNCLQSVVTQKKTENDIECILVDDCGKDKSVAIVNDFIKKYAGDIEFKIISHDKNRGLSGARNTGMQNCTGDYVLFLDSDDTLPNDSIYNLSQPLKSYSYDFVIGEVRTTGVVCQAPPLLLDEGAYCGSDVVRKTYIERLWYMMAWNKLCNLEFLKTHNIFFQEGLIHEDDMWSFILSMNANSFYVVKKDTYNYMVRTGSITTDKKHAVHIEAYLTIANNIAEYIKKYGLDTSYILFSHKYILGTYVYLRNLTFLKGYRYYKKIIANKIYHYYYKELLLEESSRFLFKVKLAHYPKLLGYIIFRVSFLITEMKKGKINR